MVNIKQLMEIMIAMILTLLFVVVLFKAISEYKPGNLSITGAVIGVSLLFIGIISSIISNLLKC